MKEEILRLAKRSIRSTDKQSMIVRVREASVFSVWPSRSLPLEEVPNDQVPVCTSQINHATKGADTLKSDVLFHRAVASPHWVCMEDAVASP